MTHYGCVATNLNTTANPSLIDSLFLKFKIYWKTQERSQYFSIFNQRKSFHQIRLSSESCQLTAFITQCFFFRVGKGTLYPHEWTGCISEIHGATFPGIQGSFGSALFSWSSCFLQWFQQSSKISPIDPTKVEKICYETQSEEISVV